MKVILRADVEKLGHLGDIVNVKPGYGRNYLLPKQLASVATPANIRVFELERKKLQAEYDELEKFIARCNEILASESEQLAIVKAETMAWMGGMKTEYQGETNMVVVNDSVNGAWIGLSGVDFGEEGASMLDFAGVSKGESAAVKIVLDSLEGECVGYVSLSRGGATSVLNTKITGKHDLFFIFAGDVCVDWWQFAK